MPSSRIAETTLVENAILGLLCQEPRTGYAIRMVFHQTALGNFSSSPGTVYPALKRMEGAGLVTKRRPPGGKQALFTITAKGRKGLRSWLLQPVTHEIIARNLPVLILQFSFMDTSLSRVETRKFLKSLSLGLGTYVDKLEGFFASESANLSVHGRISFQHGIETYRASLKWARNTLSGFSTSKQQIYES